MRAILVILLMLLASWPHPLHALQGQQVITGPYRHAPTGTPCTSLPFTDSFTRADGPLGSPWSSPLGPITVISNAAGNSSGGGAAGIAFPVGCPYSGTIQYAQFVLTNVANTYGPVLFATDANNYIYFDCNSSGNCSVAGYVAGTFHFYGAPSVSAMSVGDTVCGEISGTTIKIKINGTYQGGSISYSGGLTSGAGGIYEGGYTGTPQEVGNFQTGNGTCP